jgi:hypothetical protein
MMASSGDLTDSVDSEWKIVMPEEKPVTGPTIAAAAGVGAVAGLCIAGPITGAVAAGGLGYGALAGTGPAGSACRKAGDLGVQCGLAAKEFSDRHQVPGKAKAAAKMAVASVRRFNEAYDVTGFACRTFGRITRA